MSQVDRSKVITDTETVDQGDADTDRESPAGPEESPSLRVCDLHEVDLGDGGHHSQPLQDPAQVEQPDVALREGEDSPASQEGSTEDHQSQSPTSNISINHGLSFSLVTAEFLPNFPARMPVATAPKSWPMLLREAIQLFSSGLIGISDSSWGSRMAENPSTVPGSDQLRLTDFYNSP